jgi:hypothetical protein
MKGIPEENEKRRSVFWELLNMDCRLALGQVCMYPGKKSSVGFHNLDISHTLRFQYLI